MRRQGVEEASKFVRVAHAEGGKELTRQESRREGVVEARSRGGKQ